LPDLVHLEGFDDGGDQLHAYIPAFTVKSDRPQRRFRVVLISRGAVSVPATDGLGINDLRTTNRADAPRWRVAAQIVRYRGAVALSALIPRRGNSWRFCGFMNTTGLDDLARRLADSVPESLRAFGRDLENNFKAVLQAQLSKLDLVTRQDFDVQAAILERTQGKLAAMEARLIEIEAKLAPR